VSKAETTALVERVHTLLRDHPGMSQRSACERVGLAESTFRSRLKRAGDPIPRGRHHDDGLRDLPAAASELPVFVRDYQHLDHLHTYPVGDLHLGSPKCAEDILDEWLGYLVNAENVSMVSTGDNLNCALRTSVSDVHEEKLTVSEGRKLLTQKFRPLADKDILDGIIDGNHEDRVYNATGDSPNDAVADALGVPYARAACVIRYLVGDQQYDLFMRHGKAGGGSMGAAVNALEKQERIVDADIYVSGHIHTQVCFPKNVFVANDSGGFSRKKRLFVCSGSFLCWEDYAAAAGYAPAHIGAPRIFMDGRRHDTHGSV